ncbi:hypothetical protein A1QO_15570 [Vibrio genomosp. F10 str. ZF-129]|uniref:Uncharacterized protein n=1 Tax=Vibrio genomosp. F10 str. ZF-129 TaxID=1187848 RepID=A0A1E5BA12_9VIBR|nr:hypothetical protein [Vibrio genomosp. F10]OEE30750.1 hypothetical protein A1QO_15570 [Vibrio genomosp. F10 str. ZF-129]
MEYFALRLFGDGAMKRHTKTFEPEVTKLGDCESFEDAVKQACAQLECNHLLRGVLSQGEGAGGYMVVDAQELAAV